MNTDFQSFTDKLDLIEFLGIMVDTASQFSVAVFPETNEWMVSWPVKARLCPTEAAAYEEE